MISYTIAPSEKRVRAEMTGSNTFTDIVNFLDRVLGDAAYESHYDCLFTVAPKAHAEVLHHQEEFKQVVERLSASRDGVKWAVVMPNKFQILLAKIIMEWVKIDPVEMRYFPDEETALHWLSSARDEPACPPA